MWIIGTPIKDTWTKSRERLEVVGGWGKEDEGSSRNMYKGPMDKAKGE